METCMCTNMALSVAFFTPFLLFSSPLPPSLLPSSSSPPPLFLLPSSTEHTVSYTALTLSMFFLYIEVSQRLHNLPLLNISRPFAAHW